MKDDPFDVIAKYSKPGEKASAQRSIVDPTEGRIIAVEICSTVLEAHIWLAFDESFNPRDGQAVFYPDELQYLKNKDVQTLKELHKAKLEFGGGRVSQ